MKTSPRVTAQQQRRGLFGRSWLEGLRLPAKRRARRGFHQQPDFVAAEVLETRSLLSATFEGVVGLANGENSSVSDVATDASGNSYVTGFFYGTMDFDPATAHPGDVDVLTSHGSSDGFIAKYAPDNTLIWASRMGGVSKDQGNAITVDANGNVYVAGNHVGSADFGSTTLTTSDTQNGFVTKLDANGAFQWAKSWNASSDDYSTAIGVDSAGRVYVLGESYTTKVHQIMRFNSNGSLSWSRSLKVNTMLYGYADLEVSSTGDVYVAGSFSGTVDFDPGAKKANVTGVPTGAGKYDTFVLKLNSSGNFGWVSPFLGKTVGSTRGVSFAASLELDPSGNILVGGAFNNTVDFNPGSGTTTLTGGGGYITKLNSSGGLVWARALQKSDTTASPVVKGLATDAEGNVYAGGSFNGGIDLDPGAGVDSHTTVGSGDLYLLKLTSAGNYVWGETIGGQENDALSSLAVDPAGNLHLAGSFRGTVDFDPDPNSTFELTAPPSKVYGYRLKLGQP